jgi:outer membrane protein assembly factor BamB
MRMLSLAFACISLLRPIPARAQDWPRFGWDVAGSNSPSGSTGIAAKSLGSLKLRQVAIDGTVDSSAIYLRAVSVGDAIRDVFFVTTTYGKTIAIDADSGAALWEFTPPSYASLAGSYRITNATPVADPDRRYIYAAAPDGVVRKLAVSDGAVIWSAAITKLPEREKIASALNYFKGRVIAATDGYIGDTPPYQGHVAILDGTTGKLLHVWNSLGSDRRELLDPASYPESDSGIWGRAGVVVDPADGELYLATGNGLWDGISNWGDAVIELDPDATRIEGNYTPTETEALDAKDQDLGSTSPALLGGGLIAQGGKDGLIRLLDWSLMRGRSPHRGGEIDSLPTPSGARMFTAPAVMRSESRTWLLAADGGGTSAWVLEGRRLKLRWHAGFGGTSPVVAQGLAFVYDPKGALRVYEATSGLLLATLPCGGGHWNSPIVADGRIALPEGNANAHLAVGVLDIWSLR